ncbi:MAG TPA: S8 family peptidase [Mycobacteriales bacterium]|nr:S8 family peptidase [Mycobacteriales bacterium]
MTEPARWRDWTLVALADRRPSRPNRAERELAAIEQVAVRFADRFEPVDRAYEGDRPQWHGQVREVLAQLRGEGLLDGREQLTEDGRQAADQARDRADAPGRSPSDPSTSDTADTSGTAGTPDETGTGRPPLLTAGVIAPPLRNRADRVRMGFDGDEDRPVPVMAELNLRFRGGGDDALRRLDALWRRVTVASAGAGPDRRPTRISEQYATGSLSVQEMKRLVAADAVPEVWPQRSLHRLWPDFPVRPHVDGSCVTVKADAARRSFNAYGDRIVWAVVDSGIWAGHPHFAAYHTLDDEEVRDLHRVFPADGGPATPDGALEDATGHGTHVAGIIAGGIEPWFAGAGGRTIRVTANRYNVENAKEPLRVPRDVRDVSLLAGMAPRTKLVSLKVLQSGGTTEDRVGRLIRALAYVREVNGSDVDGMRIHGVNLSVGYEFDPEWFACGQSPLCKEVDKLVRSGVVVVVAAGNSGYGSLATTMDAPSRFGLGMTINDPGNAEKAITVGSTHRDAPHMYGVSYFSSKGPTGDGREKPDLIAPGERITSCAAGTNLEAVQAGPPDPDTAVYVEDSGTSMAAPHVSGAIAALLSVRREFIGRPDEVKRIVVDTALSLGRGRAFQGAGLLDLMGALGSV